MGWFALYLISVIVVPTVFMLFWTIDGDNDFHLSEPPAVLCAVIFCVFWPLSVTGTLYEMARKTYKKRIVDRSERLTYKHSLSQITLHDRSAIMMVPEGDLKFLLKSHRKNYIKLDKTVVELIRDELMHRNVERDLLK